MSIIGESFDPYVSNQIKTRQNVLSLKDKTNDTIKYLTDKTSFLRLTSGINVSREKSKDLGFDLSGNELAKFFTLFSANFNGNFTSDVGYSLTRSYGFASEPNYGLVPPPGIISADIKSLNRGALREANVQIICHNLSQFKVISTLFLKLRYSLLLEWGHTLYFNNSEELQSPLGIPNLSDNFIDGTFKWKDNNGTEYTGGDQEALLKSIEYNRKASFGNYDAFFGVVKNFNWELLENGSYNITINAISTGDVIESLKINSNLNSNFTANSNYSNGTQDVKFQKSVAHKILGVLQQKIKDNGNYVHGYKIDDKAISFDTDAVAFVTKLKPNFKDINDNQTVKSANNILAKNEGLGIDFNKLDPDENNKSLTQYYLKLGTLLRIIESFLLYYDKDKKIKEGNPPVFRIDHDFDKNLCFTIPEQVFSDPSICVIPLPSDISNITENASKYTLVTNTYQYIVDEFSWVLENRNENTELLPVDFEPELEGFAMDKFQSGEIVDKNGRVLSNIKENEIDPLDGYKPLLDTRPYKFSKAVIVTKRYELNTDIGIAATAFVGGNLSYIGDDYKSSDDVFIGKFMHIHVNIDYIISMLNNFTDEKDGSVSLYDFLTNLLDGIAKNLGYISNFEVIYDHDMNIIYIIDNNLVPYMYKNIQKKSIPKFNINLLKEGDNGGSFVTNFGLKSELFSKIANTIALGAQANGNTGISNSTTFSEFNKGLIDRFLTTKENINTEPPLGKNTDSANKYIEYIKLLSDKNIDRGNIDTFSSFIPDVYQYLIGNYTDNKNIPGTGFIPLNLQLTMDGLSGMKIYQTFDIDETLLPSEYQNRIRFIIRGVNHKIDTNGWYTSIETLSIPKENNLNKNIKIKSVKRTSSTTDVKKAEELLNNVSNCKKTSYPEKPVVPYKQTTISDEEVMKVLKKNFSKEVALSTFTIMKNEQPGPKGVGFKAFNNNYGGIQTDSSRWEDDSAITGRLCLKDGSGEYREFASFDSAEASIKFKGEKIKKKGIYIGGTPSKFQDNPYYNKTLSDTTGVATSYGYEWIRSKAGIADGRWQRNPFVSLIDSKYKLAEDIYNRV